MKIVEELVEKKCLLPIDLQFAVRLFPDAQEDETLLFALLLAISREGHLCLKVEEQIFPSLAFCGELRQQVEEKVRAAFARLPIEGDLRRPYYRFQNSLYLQKNWIFETKVLQHVRRLSAEKPEIVFKGEMQAGSLNQEQKQAVTHALENTLTLITGGPGTGKTFTAASIVTHLLKVLEPEQIVLAAPTGKAAARLTASLKSQGITSLTCTTLHALLNIRSAEEMESEEKILLADLLIIDECSMLDAPLFARLLSAVKRGARLVLMGDSSQLPPVNAGSLFADLTQSLPCVVLRQSLRTEQGEILRLSQAIREGNSEEVAKSVQEIRGEERFLAHFPGPSAEKPDPLALLERMDDFRLLSPVREGPYGVDQLNRRIAGYFHEKMRPGDFLAVPILIVRSDRRLNLYNGETGILLRGEEKAYFSEGRVFPVALLPSFEYAYCLSVHKSQGSEYENVFLALPPGSEVFGRELLYTAVTRARQTVVIEGSREIVYKVMERSSRRASNLQERL